MGFKKENTSSVIKRDVNFSSRQRANGRLSLLTPQHRPCNIQQLLETLEKFGVLIGSRYDALFYGYWDTQTKT